METNDKDIAISNNNKDINCARFEAASTIASAAGNTISTVTNSLKEIALSVLECKRNYDNIQQTIKLSDNSLKKIDKLLPINQEKLEKLDNKINGLLKELDTFNTKEMTVEEHKTYRMLVQSIVQLSEGIIHITDNLD